MGAPNVKLYILPAGYSESLDNDIQRQEGDELLPFVRKPETLQETRPLHPVTPYTRSALQPVDLVTGRRQAIPLGPDGASVQAPTDGFDLAEALVVYEGPLAIALTDDSGTIAHERWELHEDGIHFAEPHPSNVEMSCYQKAATPATAWALAGPDLYTGTNHSFNKILLYVDGQPARRVTPATGDNSYVTTDAPAEEVLATYAVRATVTKHFIGDHDNWVVDHYEMRPDVFVGETDYPGDVTTNEQGDAEDPLELPSYVPPTEYTLRAREGMVIFSEAVDVDEVAYQTNPSLEPVRANYAYLSGIRNVDGQRLDEVPASEGLRFKADTDQAFPDAVGKRWVGRRSATLPRNVYVDGTPTPAIKTMLPYDTLTIKTGN